jgi:riboflavin biosynthesis pyrimidine reductase
MNVLDPFEVLYASNRGPALPLPPELAQLFGQLEFPPHAGHPLVIGNFVSTLDGVVALDATNTGSGGGEISGFDQHDAALMGLLRAVADAVIVGAGTLRAAPDHRWTARFIYPPLAPVYQQLRYSLGTSEPPLNVIVTAGGNLDLSLPVYQSGEVPVLIVTTRAGANRLNDQAAPPWVKVEIAGSQDSVSAAAVLQATLRHRPCDLILTEGGPRLMGSFFAERLLDELFLTLAPQVAGRDGSVERPSFVSGMQFAPPQPIWGTLVDVRRSGSHLFLRYAF